MEGIRNVLKSCFNITALQLSALEGYDSTNYKVVAPEGAFVLKIYADTPQQRQLLEAEHHILMALKSAGGYDFPAEVLSISGSYFVQWEGAIYRLLSFIEGEFLGQVDHSTPLLLSFGRFLGIMDSIVFSAYEVPVMAKESQWDLQHLEKNKQFLSAIPNPKDRSLVAYFFMQYAIEVLPFKYDLRKGVIHGDANDWNVLTKKGKVTGIIDFGDMCYSWLINELAIGLTYVIMGKDNPMDSALPVIQGYCENFPLEEREVDLLYYLIAARLCISVCNSAHTKTLKPDSPYITISEQPAWDVLRKWIRINPIAARRVFRAAAGLEVGNQPSLPAQLSRRKAYSGAALSLSYSQPIEMVQSAFQYMYDSEGNTFLDAYNNIMLSGHCHPKVVTAGQRTMAKLNTNTRYIYEEYLRYSEKLLAKFPAHLNKVFFVNSGSAASDLAIRMAMTYTGKKKIMVVEHGYHGNTRTGIDISHYKYSNASGQGKQDYVLETPLPKVFNSGFAKESEVARHFGQLALGQIRANQAAIAAFIAEPIVGCGGQVPLAAGYLKEVYKGIREQGGICISDEVQVGFGRLGDFFWGYERHDVVPDMVILGKPMGNGHPIGAVVTTSEIAESFNNGVEFFSSFGGNPVSCAIGSAVLDVIEEERLQQHAKEIGDHLMGLLNELKKEFREIADVRGSGLFLGVEMLDNNGQPHTALAGVIKNKLRENHILVGTDGPFDSVLKIKPPLSFTLADAEELVKAIRLILRNVVFFE